MALSCFGGFFVAEVCVLCDETWVLFAWPVCAVSPAFGVAFGGCFLRVVFCAEGSEVCFVVAGVAVAVVDVGCWVGAALAVDHPGALVVVAFEDGGPDLRPVAGEGFAAL